MLRWALSWLSLMLLGCVEPKLLPSIPPPAPGVVTRILGLRAPKATSWELLAYAASEPGFALLTADDPEREIAIFDYDAPLAALGLGLEGRRVSTLDAESPLLPPLKTQTLKGGAWQESDFLALNVRVNYRCPALRAVDQRLGKFGDTLAALIPIGGGQALAAVQVRPAPGDPPTSTVFFVLDPERDPTPWPPARGFPAEPGRILDPSVPFAVQMLVDPVNGHPNILVNSAVLIELDEGLSWVKSSTLPPVLDPSCAPYPFKIAGGSVGGALELYTLGRYDTAESVDGAPGTELYDVCRVRAGEPSWTPIGWRAAGADAGFGCKIGLDLVTLNWKGPGRLEIAARRPVGWTYDASRTPAFSHETLMPSSIGSAQNLEYCRVSWLPETRVGPMAAVAFRVEAPHFLSRRERSGWQPQSERASGRVVAEWGNEIVADAGEGLLRLGYVGEGFSAARTYTCEPETLAIDTVSSLLVRGEWLLAAGNPNKSDALYVTWLQRAEP